MTAGMQRSLLLIVAILYKTYCHLYGKSNRYRRNGHGHYCPQWHSAENGMWRFLFKYNGHVGTLR